MVRDTDTRRIGQVAYEAYYEFSEGRSLVSGAALPAWKKLEPSIQAAWMYAAFHGAKAYLEC